jgi:hypothetical protein
MPWAHLAEQDGCFAGAGFSRLGCNKRLEAASCKERDLPSPALRLLASASPWAAVLLEKIPLPKKAPV